MNTLPSNKPLKTMLNALALTFLLLAMSSHCLAMMSVGNVSKEQAKELGITIRATANGPNEVWVEMEFKAEGKLKDFSHVSLEISDGEKFLMGYTALGEKRTGKGSIVVTFLTNRAYLEKITLRVVLGEPMNYSGWDVRVKDFVELEKLH